PLRPRSGVRQPNAAARRPGLARVTPAPVARHDPTMRKRRIDPGSEVPMSTSAKILIAGLVLALLATALAPAWPLELVAGLGGGLLGLLGGALGLAAGVLATVFATLLLAA